MKTRILVIEDERTALQSLALLLQDEGYEVLQAESGETGLPFLLHRAGLNPAGASAPFVATLVNVTGLII